jgi:enoyl-CoA hydratase/carnithine racemase
MAPQIAQSRRKPVAYETLLIDTTDRVQTIALNRPERLNAWTRQMQTELKDAMYAAGEDAGVRAIILTGTGRGFCAGADIENLQAIGQGQSAGVSDRSLKARRAPDGGSELPDFQLVHSYFPSIPKPIIAAINGPCAGLGLVIALYCDLRFAADNATFTTAFAMRGLIAEHGISWLLPRLCGPANAFDILGSARKFRGAEAKELGVVNRVYPADQLMAETRNYARMLAETVSPRSLAIIKRQLWEAQFQTLAEATVRGNYEMELSFGTEDFKEGVAHFVEKRPARFTGR